MILDSNHTHEHVFKELELYAPFVTIGSYIVVFDTIVEDLPDGYFEEARPWGIGNNPKTAVRRIFKYQIRILLLIKQLIINYW